MGREFVFYLDFLLVIGIKANNFHANVREDIPVKRVTGMYPTMNSYFLFFFIILKSIIFPQRYMKIYYHSIRFFFLSIGQESTTWPANNWLQIMVCSRVVPSKRVLLQKNILFMRNWNHVLERKMAGRFPELSGSDM